MHHRSDRLRAFCSITIDDDFVVHDLRVIEGRKGFFVAMPSRKLSDNCPQCGGKNELRSKFCSECGARLSSDRLPRAASAHDKLHVDVAHPINTPCREMLQDIVLRAYEEEEERAKQGLAPRHEYLPEGLDDLSDHYPEPETAAHEDEGDKAEEDDLGWPAPAEPPTAQEPPQSPPAYAPPAAEEAPAEPETPAPHEAPEAHDEGSLERDLPAPEEGLEPPSNQEGAVRRSQPRSNHDRPGGGFGDGIL
jgi:stage V sporulation protein G